MMIPYNIDGLETKYVISYLSCSPEHVRNELKGKITAMVIM